jgi:hypothetical protein
MRRALLILPLLIFLVLAGFFLSSLMSKRALPRPTSKARRWSTSGPPGVWPAASSTRCSTVWRLKAW